MKTGNLKETCSWWSCSRCQMGSELPSQSCKQPRCRGTTPYWWFPRSWKCTFSTLCCFRSFRKIATRGPVNWTFLKRREDFSESATPDKLLANPSSSFSSGRASRFACALCSKAWSSSDWLACDLQILQIGSERGRTERTCPVGKQCRTYPELCLSALHTIGWTLTRIGGWPLALRPWQAYCQVWPLSCRPLLRCTASAKFHILRSVVSLSSLKYFWVGIGGEAAPIWTLPIAIRGWSFCSRSGACCTSGTTATSSVWGRNCVPSSLLAEVSWRCFRSGSAFQPRSQRASVTRIFAGSSRLHWMYPCLLRAVVGQRAPSSHFHRSWPRHLVVICCTAGDVCGPFLWLWIRWWIGVWFWAWICGALTNDSSANSFNCTSHFFASLFVIQCADLAALDSAAYLTAVLDAFPDLHSGCLPI